MRTHLEIIAAAGGYKALADKLGLERERLRFWTKRESIPPEWWGVLVDAGLTTLEELQSAAEAKKLPEVAERRAAQGAAA